MTTTRPRSRPRLVLPAVTRVGGSVLSLLLASCQSEAGPAGPESAEAAAGRELQAALLRLGDREDGVEHELAAQMQVVF